MRSQPLAHVRRNLVRGLVLVLPLLITLWLLGILFHLLDARVTPVVRRVLGAAGMPGLELWFARLGVPIIGLVLTAACIYLLGLVGGHIVGRRLLRWVESGILRVPLVKTVYGASRQLLDAFSADGSGQFSRVVAVPYPREGVWTMGFVTQELALGAVPGLEGPLVAVFLPTTPNPTSGWLGLFRREDVREIDIGVEDAMKLIVSGGIVFPAPREPGDRS